MFIVFTQSNNQNLLKLQMELYNQGYKIFRQTTCKKIQHTGRDSDSTVTFSRNEKYRNCSRVNATFNHLKQPVRNSISRLNELMGDQLTGLKILLLNSQTLLLKQHSFVKDVTFQGFFGKIVKFHRKPERFFSNGLKLKQEQINNPEI